MPAPIQKLLRRFSALFQKQKLDARMDDEMRLHIELQTQENIAAGMLPEEARYAALRQFGHTDSLKETCRDQRGVRWIENCHQELRFAFRSLRKSPAFTAIAVLTLALGIGASALIFSVAKGVLFRQLSFDTERLAYLRNVDQKTARLQDSFSWTDYTDLSAQTKSFEQLAIFAWPGVTWQQGDRLNDATSLSVSPGFLEMLRLQTLSGRSFLEEDSKPGAPPVAILSHEFWQNRLAADPEILGKVLRIEEKPHTIIGILPPGVVFPLGHPPATGAGTSPSPKPYEIWLPLKVEGEDRTGRAKRMFSLIARLKPNIDAKAARQELADLSQRWSLEYPDTNRNLNFEMIPFRDQLLGRARHGIQILAAAVAAVLLVCCVNLSNLLLARGLVRQRELAVRRALGAGRARLLSALLTESLLLALLGAAGGIALAAIGIDLLHAFGPAQTPFLREIALDGTALAFTLALCIITALASGFLPALWQSRIKAYEALKSGSRSTRGTQFKLWQKTLLIGQISLALALLASAGLLLESFRRLLSQDLGYKVQSVIAVDINTYGFPTNGDTCRMYRALRERLAALAGVEAVGTMSSAPLTSKWTFDERPDMIGNPKPLSERPSLAAAFVAFDYFQALQIPLIEGRYFRDDELKDDGYGQIVIINQAAAQLLSPGQSAIGKRFTVGSNPDRVLEIIGVVKDTRDVRLEEKPLPRFYWQYAFGGAQLLVSAAVPAQAIIPLLRETIENADPRIKITSIAPMTDIVSSSVAERRFLMSMLAIYAAMALAIAAIGIFGVVTCQVTQRTNEFGIRLALGESPAGLMRLVLHQTTRIVLTGLVIGCFLTLATTRLLQSQLFEISPHDPTLLLTVNLLLLTIALLATWAPARRASKVDPIIALRYE